MKDINIKNRIVKLRQEISRLRMLYHVENNPKVTDDVYESLTRELHDLENKYPMFIDQNSLVNRVAGEPLPFFKKVKHDIRVLSLNDAFSLDEVISWENRIIKLLDNTSGKKVNLIDKIDYFCEIKLDGLSASLFYKDGLFVRGATRGDGFIGEDVTENLKMIESIPIKLKGDIKGEMEVRGEVIMTKKAWQTLNKKQENSGKITFANTRNAAAGSLRQLDPRIAKERNLDFFAWDISQTSIEKYKMRIKNHSDKHEILKELGFQMTPYEKKAKNLKEVFYFIKEIGQTRDKLSYGTDGMVISVICLLINTQQKGQRLLSET
jgi:DNA ligase (NAD+)